MMYDDDTNKLESMFPSMVVCGTIEFKMDKKSYRMIPLANSEDYLYNLATLNKAKQVRRRGNGVGVRCTCGINLHSSFILPQKWNMLRLYLECSCAQFNLHSNHLIVWAG